MATKAAPKVGRTGNSLWSVVVNETCKRTVLLRHFSLMGKKPLFSRRVYGTFRKNADLLEDSELSFFGPAFPFVGAGGADLRAFGGLNVAYDVGRPAARGDELAPACGTCDADSSQC